MRSRARLFRVSRISGRQLQVGEWAVRSLVDSVRKGELEGLNSDGILELEACGGEILVVGVGEID